MKNYRGKERVNWMHTYDIYFHVYRYLYHFMCANRNSWLYNNNQKDLNEEKNTRNGADVCNGMKGKKQHNFISNRYNECIFWMIACMCVRVIILNDQ